MAMAISSPAPSASLLLSRSSLSISCFGQNTKLSLRATPTALPALKHFSGGKISRRNDDWVRRNAKSSADPDANSDEFPSLESNEPDSSGETSSPSSSSSSSPAASSFLSVLCPLLKLFSSGDPSKDRNFTLEMSTSYLSTLARLPWGSKSIVRLSWEDQETTGVPLKPLQLFEFEACPFCRRVREAMTELDLSAEVYPCPKGSRKHREIVRKLGGKEQFPFLVDPNTGILMYESGDVVKYLFQQYGQGKSPSMGLLESTLLTGWVPTILRAGRGMTLWEKARSEMPSMKLEFFSYENNPYARIVREALCELEIPYILRNVGSGSRSTKSLLDVYGSQEVPFLVDPNTGVQLGDYKKMLVYLFQTYSEPATES
ncbi:unnamed protein product [Linum trigynum]|uniref:GST N-terminal domain-containing protein n=1 Tax=Linum trigynum TaxID=586398 RepID=A0AAV2GGQ2_9ROSI